MKQQTIKEDAAAEDMWDRLERQNEEHKKSYDEFLRTLEKSCAKCPHVKTENKGTRAECAVCTHEGEHKGYIVAFKSFSLDAPAWCPRRADYR